MKGQISVEFLASMFIFLLAMVLTLGMLSDQVPTFKEDITETSRHLEATTLTNQLLTNPGSHNYGGGGTNWEKNTSTIRNINTVGLTSKYLVVEEKKLGNMSTVGDTKFNYSNFLNLMEPKYSYHLTFTWMPTVNTYRSFRKGSPPSQPDITEPVTGLYQDADNKSIHYGNITLHGGDYKFLVTSHNGRYNTTYISKDWDFSSSITAGLEDSFQLPGYGESFEVASFQNRPDRKGTIIILRQEVKRFGASKPTESETTKLNRYAALNAPRSDLEPLKIEVLTW